MSISSLHSSSPLLFWTVIAIVTSRDTKPLYVALFDQLERPFLEQLRTEILQAPVPLHVIQSLAYLITWPFFVPNQTTDPSWLYCGTAINAALYMGLHRSRPIQPLRTIGVAPGSLRARALTWLGCFFASTSLSIFVGISPSINGTTDLNTIEHFVREYPMPREFAYQIMVQHTLAKYTSVIQELSREPINYSLVKIIDAELDGLKAQYPTEWTPRVELTTLVSKLHLYTMAIVQMQSDLMLREILLKLGFSVSLRIVYLMDQDPSYRSNDYRDMPAVAVQRTLPREFTRGLVLATVFLLRYFALNTRATAEERELARTHIGIAHTFVKAGSTAPQDQFARVARLFETLSRQQPVDIDNTKLKINDRMGWSLVHDAIATGQALRNQPTEVEDSTPNDMAKPQPIVRENVTNVNHETPDFDPTMMDGYGPLDFTLPDDIWGDSLWGVFDIGVPSSPK